MAAIVNIPFNFQPVTSPSRKTASYTVPANRYAKAILSFYQPRSFNAGTNQTVNGSVGSITINGVAVLNERQFNVSMYCTATGFSQSTVNISGFYGLFMGWAAQVGYGGGSLVSVALATGQTFSGAWFCQFNGTGQCTTPSVGQSGLVAQASGCVVSMETPEFLEVWLKPGDVINATAGNWQAIVTEYAIPS